MLERLLDDVAEAEGVLLGVGFGFLFEVVCHGDGDLGAVLVVHRRGSLVFVFRRFRLLVLCGRGRCWRIGRGDNASFALTELVNTHRLRKKRGHDVATH